MAQGINLVQNPPSYSGKGVDTTNQPSKPQPSLKDQGNPAGAARTRFAFDDVTPGGAGAGTVGNGQKPFRVSGG